MYSVGRVYALAMWVFWFDFVVVVLISGFQNSPYIKLVNDGFCSLRSLFQLYGQATPIAAATFYYIFTQNFVLLVCSLYAFNYLFRLLDTRVPLTYHLFFF